MKRPDLWFGVGLVPGAVDVEALLSIARLADDLGLDFVSVQDHPYNPNFLESWTLLAYIAARTRSVRLITDVANLPLRPPAMLAKAAASLDILSGGRVELGLGAGALWSEIAAYGGPTRTPGQSVDALEEAIYIIRSIWQLPAKDQSISYQGTYYQLEKAQPGPMPAHPIGIWLGAYHSRMLRLTGQLADGWIPSSTHLPPEEINGAQDIIDAAARECGREPAAIRRAYNITGRIQVTGQLAMRTTRLGTLIGPRQYWVDELQRYVRDLHLDAFSFSPIGADYTQQLHLFAQDVMPAVRLAARKMA